VKTDSIHTNTITTATDTTLTSADSLHNRPFQAKYLHGFDNEQQQDSVVESMHNNSVLTIPSGKSSEYYYPNPLHDTGTMLMFLLSMFFVTLSMRKGVKYLYNLNKNLFSLRRRDNLFDDHNTVNEVITIIALVSNTCIMESIIINSTILFYYPSLLLSTNIFTYTILLIASVVAFYLLQMAAYTLLGYVFTSKVNTTLLLKGFNASQSLLGLFLIPLVILLLVYPTYVNTFVILFAILYICCRIIFIIKGFRIFFTNYSSVFFFILYLCSGEIIPLLVMYSGITLLYSTI